MALNLNLNIACRLLGSFKALSTTALNSKNVLPLLLPPPSPQCVALDIRQSIALSCALVSLNVGIFPRNSNLYGASVSASDREFTTLFTINDLVCCVYIAKI